MSCEKCPYLDRIVNLEERIHDVEDALGINPTADCRAFRLEVIEEMLFGTEQEVSE